jgi:hypothetical protein
MTISIDWGNTNIIDVELADLTPVSGTIYSFDTNAFRLTLKDLEDSREGAAFPRTHKHNTEDTISGTTYARGFIILPPYSVRFPDQQITVRLIGSNNNIDDVENGILVQNQCQVISSNAAGLITTVTGSGVTATDKTDIRDLIMAVDVDGIPFERILRILAAAAAGTVRPTTGDGYEVDAIDGSKPRIVGTDTENGRDIASVDAS